MCVNTSLPKGVGLGCTLRALQVSKQLTSPLAMENYSGNKSHARAHSLDLFKRKRDYAHVFMMKFQYTNH